jgi:tetratricopeptide (TPR) repeat protein
MTQASLIGDWATASRAGMILDNVVTSLRWHGADVERPDVLGLCRKANDRLSEALHVNNLAVDLYFDGDWEGAARMYRASAEGCAVCGHVVSEATALNNIAEILSDQGRFADAEPLFRTAYRTWRSVGFGTGIALAEANLGRLASRTDRLDEADRLLASSLARFERMGAQAFVEEVALRQYENRLRGPHRPDDAALDELRALAAMPQLDANLAAYAQRLIAQSHHRRDDGPAALAAVDRSIDVARDAGIPFELAQSLALRARLSSGESAERDGVEADEIFDRLGVLTRPSTLTSVTAGA